MKLDKDAINDIAGVIEHFMENGEMTPKGEKEYQKILDLCNSVSVTIGLKLETYEIVPSSRDVVVNLLVEKALTLEYGTEEQILYENAFWEYMLNKYKFDHEEHHLLKHTMEEAMSYAILHAGIKEDYNP